MRRALGLVLVLAVALAAAACDEPEPTWAYKLSVLNAGDEEHPDRSMGREAAEAEFQRVLDCVTEAFPGETEASASDTLFVGWEQSQKTSTLLAYAQALCAIGEANAP